ncbi:MAG: VTT domain-containing protein [Alphaproteobacteria bacterium]|nr:VTT domain-containing protein [Alphaproteobacteria bacterium]
MNTPPHAPSGDSLAEDIDLRGLVLRMLAGIGLFMLALGLIAFAFQDALLGVGRAFVEHLGGPGVALGFFLPDALTIPVPHEGILALAVMGGLDFWAIAAWASAGSLVGGAVGYQLGRLLGGTAWFHRVTGRQGDAARFLVAKHGEKAVAAGAITPLPYCLMAWSCGALGMPFDRFMLVSLWRVPRVLFYLWLVEMGVIAALA